MLNKTPNQTHARIENEKTPNKNMLNHQQQKLVHWLPLPIKLFLKCTKIYFS